MFVYLPGWVLAVGLPLLALDRCFLALADLLCRKTDVPLPGWLLLRLERRRKKKEAGARSRARRREAEDRARLERRTERAAQAARKTLRGLSGEKELLAFDCPAYEKELAARFRLTEQAASAALYRAGLIQQKRALLLRKYPQRPQPCIRPQQEDAEYVRRGAEFKISAEDARLAYALGSGS